MDTENLVDSTVKPAVEATAESNGHVHEEALKSQATTSARGTLYRHPTEKMVGGVCGGLADYLGWDPTLVRILWVVATLTTGGGGFLAYLALWMLLPVGTVAGGQVQPAAIELNERNLGLAAKALIVFGVLWLLSNVGILPSLWSGFWAFMQVVFWPALLIGIGYLLLRGTGNSNWRFDFSNWQNRFRANIKTPSGGDVTSSLRQLHQQIPLKRSRRDRMFMGVCGGIGQKLGIDANLIRLIWAAFSIGSIGMGVLIYVLAGLLLPEEAPAYLSTNGVNAPNVQDVQVIDGTATYKV
jgi:phage shock protein PspC (stress-responsive transcriptional regulator)